MQDTLRVRRPTVLIHDGRGEPIIRGWFILQKVQSHSGQRYMAGGFVLHARSMQCVTKRSTFMTPRSRLIISGDTGLGEDLDLAGNLQPDANSAWYGARSGYLIPDVDSIRTVRPARVSVMPCHSSGRSDSRRAESFGRTSPLLHATLRRL